MKYTQDYCKKLSCESIELEVFTNNEAAIKLYEKLKFKKRYFRRLLYKTITLKYLKFNYFMRTSKQFFGRLTEEVAESLVNKYLVRKLDEEIWARIVETEAYVGEGSRDKHTIYAEPGTIYMYPLRGSRVLCVTTEKEGTPACVLIKKAEIDKKEYGPIKLTEKLKIRKEWDGRSIENDELYFDDGILFEKIHDLGTCRGRYKARW
jgi:hypothetical protein